MCSGGCFASASGTSGAGCAVGGGVVTQLQVKLAVQKILKHGGDTVRRDDNGNIHKGDRVVVLPENGDEAAGQFLALVVGWRRDGTAQLQPLRDNGASYGAEVDHVQYARLGRVQQKARLQHPNMGALARSVGLSFGAVNVNTIFATEPMKNVRKNLLERRREIQENGYSPPLAGERNLQHHPSRARFPVPTEVAIPSRRNS